MTTPVQSETTSIPSGVLGDIVERPMEACAAPLQLRPIGGGHPSPASGESGSSNSGDGGGFPSARARLAQGREYGIAAAATRSAKQPAASASIRGAGAAVGVARGGAPVIEPPVNVMPQQSVQLTDDDWDALRWDTPESTSDAVRWERFAGAFDKCLTSLVASHRVAAMTSCAQWVSASPRHTNAFFEWRGCCSRVALITSNVGGASLSAHTAAMELLTSLFCAADQERQLKLHGELISGLSTAPPDADENDEASGSYPRNAKEFYLLDGDASFELNAQADVLMLEAPARTLLNLGLAGRVVRMLLTGQQTRVWQLLAFLAEEPEAARALAGSAVFREHFENFLSARAMNGDVSSSGDAVDAFRLLWRLGVASKRSCTVTLACTRNALFAILHQLVELRKTAGSSGGGDMEWWRVGQVSLSSFAFLRCCARFGLDVAGDFFPIVPLFTESGSLAFVEMLVVVCGAAELADDILTYVTRELPETLLQQQQQQQQSKSELPAPTLDRGRGTGAGATLCAGTALQCLASWISSVSAPGSTIPVDSVDALLRSCCITDSVLATAFAALRGGAATLSASTTTTASTAATSAAGVSPQERHVRTPGALRALHNLGVVRFLAAVALKYPMKAELINGFLRSLLSVLDEVVRRHVALDHGGRADSHGASAKVAGQALAADPATTDELLTAVEAVAHLHRFCDPQAGRRAASAREVASAAFSTLALIAEYKHGLDAVGPILLPALGLDRSSPLVGYFLPAIGATESIQHAQRWLLAPLLQSRDADVLQAWSSWLVKHVVPSCSSLLRLWISYLELALECLLCQLANSHADLHAAIDLVLPLALETSRGGDQWQGRETHRFETLFAIALQQVTHVSPTMCLALAALLQHGPPHIVLATVRGVATNETAFRELHAVQLEHNMAIAPTESRLPLLVLDGPPDPRSAKAFGKWKVADLIDLVSAISPCVRPSPRREGVPYFVMAAVARIVAVQLESCLGNFEAEALRSAMEECGASSWATGRVMSIAECFSTPLVSAS